MRPPSRRRSLSPSQKPRRRRHRNRRLSRSPGSRIWDCRHRSRRTSHRWGTPNRPRFNRASSSTLRRAVTSSPSRRPVRARRPRSLCRFYRTCTVMAATTTDRRWRWSWRRPVNWRCRSRRHFAAMPDWTRRIRTIRTEGDAAETNHRAASVIATVFPLPRFMAVRNTRPKFDRCDGASMWLSARRVALSI